jgi:hypothetical protein
MTAAITDIALDLGLFALELELERGDDRRREPLNEPAETIGQSASRNQS